tara:strand:- start:8042 stop:9295 length:1254 start_codon:yes stop_codon:yes gene_type:complete
MGNVVNAKSKVPQLRFPEFSGSWASYKLGALSEIRSASRVHKEQWTESGVPFFRTSDVVAAHKGRDNRKVFISNDLYEELSKKTGKVKANDVLVTGGGSIGVPYLIPNDEPLYFKDADLLWFSNKNSLNGLYLYEFLLSPKFRRHLERISHKGTISHYTIEQAKKTPIILPKLSEQQKIADLLSSVNNRISLLEQKHEQLVQYKKGIMQQLFSQKLRFKDDNGQDFPDWEDKKLNTLLTEHKKRNRDLKYNKGDVLSVSGGLGVINQIEHLGRSYAGESVRDYHIVHEGDIVYTKSPLKANPYGIIKANKGKAGIVSTLYAVYSCKNTANYEYLEYYFWIDANTNRYLRPLVQKGAKNDMKINNQRVLIDRISVPSKQEQDKIVKFLKALDEKIFLAGQKLEQTQVYKQGLSQQMFV